MKHRRRLGSLESKLNVRQLVSLHIQEARKSPSLMSYARSLAGTPTLPPTLCQRIADLYPKADRETDPVVHHELMCAVREGLFLAHLWGGCVMSVVEGWRQWSLEAQVLSYRLVLIWATESTKGQQMLEWIHEAKKMLRGIKVHVEAVQLIAREYFGGEALLFRADEERVLALLLSIEEMIELAAREYGDDLRAAEGRGAEASPLQAGGRDCQFRGGRNITVDRIVADRVRIARTHALTACGNTEDTESILEQMFLHAADEVR
jgi:hypothetical protein